MKFQELYVLEPLCVFQFGQIPPVVNLIHRIKLLSFLLNLKFTAILGISKLDGRHNEFMISI